MVDASAYIVAAVFYLLMNFVVTKFFVAGKAVELCRPRAAEEDIWLNK